MGCVPLPVQNSQSHTNIKKPERAVSANHYGKLRVLLRLSTAGVSEAVSLHFNYSIYFLIFWQYWKLSSASAVEVVRTWILMCSLLPLEACVTSVRYIDECVLACILDILADEVKKIDSNNWSMDYCCHLEVFRMVLMYIIPTYLHFCRPGTNYFTVHTHCMKKSISCCIRFLYYSIVYYVNRVCTRYD